MKNSLFKQIKLGDKVNIKRARIIWEPYINGEVVALWNKDENISEQEVKKYFGLDGLKNYLNKPAKVDRVVVKYTDIKGHDWYTVIPRNSYRFKIESNEE